MKKESFYMPVLKWKQGEYLALRHLDEGTKLRIRPLIEIVGPGFDFEDQKDSKTIEEHLESFPARYKKNWDNRGAYICYAHVNPSLRMDDKSHPFFWLLDQLNKLDLKPVPTLFLDSDEAIIDAVLLAYIVSGYSKIALRLKLEDMLEENLEERIDSLLGKFRLKPEECDLILDAGAPDFTQSEAFEEMLTEVINSLPYLEEWENLNICSSSFPKMIPKEPMSIVPRSEWAVYKRMRRSKKLSRIPNYGDYCIAHPENDLLLDMRKVKPSGKVRYATKDSWIIVKGPNVRDNGFGQFVGHCQKISKHEHFDGPEVSYGDKYIKECAEGKAKTGVLRTWKTVDNNRHITRVVRDLFASAS